MLRWRDWPRYRRLFPGETILVIGASGAVGTALLDLSRHFGLKAIGTCSAANLATVARFGATAIDYRADDFVASVRKLTAGRVGGVGVDAAFDAIGGSHFDRSFACLAPGGILIGYGSQTMAIGRENIIAAGLGLARLKLWGALSFLFRGRRAIWYSITDRRLSHPEEFRADRAALFELLRNGAIHPVVIDRVPLAAAKNVHARIDAGGLGGKIVLLPWLASQVAVRPLTASLLLRGSRHQSARKCGLPGLTLPDFRPKSSFWNGRLPFTMPGATTSVASRLYTLTHRQGELINLNDGSGVELRHGLKAAGVSTPVIYITGNEDPAVRRAALDSGCVAFLKKPFSAQSLIEPLKKASAGRS